ncbi:hypothetical protein [Frankia sp. QA3]|uniref:hypothetical protein n=2 Tax=Frankia sp. QA3 TaxID=710111 RepID=UPI0002E6D5FF
MTRVAEAQTEQVWLSHARFCTAGQLERLVRSSRQARGDQKVRRAGRRVSWACRGGSTTACCAPSAVTGSAVHDDDISLGRATRHVDPTAIHAPDGGRLSLDGSLHALLQRGGRASAPGTPLG